MEPTSPRILLAERNPNIRQFLFMQLMQEGIASVMAATGYEARKCLDQMQSLEVMVLDPELPDVSVLYTPDQRYFTGSIRVILFAFEDEFDPALQMFATACVVKTEAPDALVSAVTSVLTASGRG
ncbi:MAG: hypothetical protein MI749_08515 [Desulfovibrionales bacterium]|nr:hypothetical protein [Desulfovibrionales bacterium]